MFEHFIEPILEHPSFNLLVCLALLGGFVVLFGLVSLFVKERLYLSESLVATVFGVIIGPVGLRLVRPDKWFGGAINADWVTQELARMLIALQIMAVGTTVPGNFALEHMRSILLFLFPITTAMWLVSAASIWLFLPFDWLESLIIGACLAPTDPVLASSVIKGKFASRYIPTHLQHLLALESGANDGLGLPFLMLPILLIKSASTSDALKEWAIHTWLYEIILALGIGASIGMLARFLLRQSEKRHLIDKESFLVFSIALTLLVTGVVALIKSDDFLAVFAAGNAFAWDAKFLEKTEESHLGDVLDMLFNISFFIFFGATIPWAMFRQVELWRLFAAAAAILLFRRLPAVMLLKRWIPLLRNRKEAFFAGWFGPMGVGAIFFSIMTRQELGMKSRIGSLCPVMVTFFVLSSILVHGITVPLTNSQMKKRARRKAKRLNKIRAQLETIADFAEEMDDAEEYVNGDSNDPEKAAEEERQRSREGSKRFLQGAILATAPIAAPVEALVARGSTSLAVSPTVRLQDENDDESEYTHYTASESGSETPPTNADIETGHSQDSSMSAVVQPEGAGAKLRPPHHRKHPSMKRKIIVTPTVAAVDEAASSTLLKNQPPNLPPSQ